MHASLFYATYTSDNGLSLSVESVVPFYKALNKISSVYIIPRSSIEHFHGEPRLECACGLIVEHALMSCAGTIESKYTIYVAEELPHGERLVTIAHELIHLILVMQGFSLDSQVNSEQWIDEIAKRFYQENPGFLNWVYTSSARIAG